MAKARSPPARSACFPHPVRRKPPGRSVAAQEAPLEIYNDETTYTYSPPFERAGRASYGVDVRAGYLQWPRGSGRVLSDSPSVHVVHFRLV